MTVEADTREFAPSGLLLRMQRRARQLGRNVEHTATFSPRLHRRFQTAAKLAHVREARERHEFDAGGSEGA